MSIKKKFIIYFAIIFVVFSSISFYSVVHNISISKYLNQKIPDSINIIQNSSKQGIVAQLVRYDDEVLTQSARNYVFTGEQKWKDRYYEFVPKLDLRIKEAIKYGDKTDEEIFNGINDANIALVKLEEEAIRYADNKNFIAAQKVLESKEYWDQKAIYKSGLDKYIARTGMELDSANSVSTTSIKEVEKYLSIHFNMSTELILVLIFIFFITLVFLAYFIYKTFLQPLNVFKKTAREITEGNLKAVVHIKNKDEIGDFAVDFNKMTENLNNLYENLDKKVAEQTKELRDKTKELGDQKMAVLNILEDVQKEKNKAEELAAIVRDANEPIVSQDLDGTILSWNHGAQDLYGYLPEEIIGKSIKLIIPEDKNEEYEEMKKTIKTAPMVKIEHYQTVRKKKNGDLVDVAISISPIMNSAEEVTGISVITLDITKEKEIDKAKTEFVSLASHQLRTPLSSINWYTEMLLAGDAGSINEEQKKYLNEVAIGNQRMVDLVDSLLNVSRLDLGTFIVEPEPTNLKEMAESVLNELKPQINEKKIKVEEIYQENIPEFQADKKLLRMVFQNLLSNAVKYTNKEGIVKLEVSMIPKETVFHGKEIREDSLLITVSDSGIGIPVGQKDRIFSKMFRADNARESETEGTGLGLYIIKSIVDKSDGLIWFESEENKGTTFFVTFPQSGMKKKEGSKKLD